MILNINAEVNLEMFNNLVNAYNQLYPDDILDIYFASVGGDVSIVYAMLDLVDKNRDRTILTGYSHLFSSGFKFFFQANCEKKLLPQVDGMYHLTNIVGLKLMEGAITHNSEYETFLRKKLKGFPTLDETSQFVDFTEDEIDRIKNNYDEYFSYNRLEKMLKYNKKYLGL